MDKALQTMIDNMPSKTGKSLEQWFTVLEKQNFEKHGQSVSFLKSEHGVSHGFANTIVSLFRKRGVEEVDLVEAQYAGKENLRPVFDELDKLITSLGPDIKVTPKKGSVSYIRKHQFALVKPATKSRIDLGLKIRGQDPSGILEDSGPFGSMCTHRIQIKDLSDVTEKVAAWIKIALEQSV